MKRTVLSCLAALFMFFQAAADVDLNAIKVDVAMKPAQYRELLHRYTDGDLTLTTEDMTKVYYGFAYTADYQPGADYEDIAQVFDTKDYSTALMMTEAALLNDPVSLELNLMALSCAEELKKTGTDDTAVKKSTKYRARLDALAGAILKSGHGTYAESPFVVLYSADVPYLLRNIIGVDQILGSTTVGPVEAVKFNFPGKDRQHILYFDNAPERQYHNQ